MNYNNFFKEKIKTLKADGNFRIFADLKRKVGKFPKADMYKDDGSIVEVISWCANDYMGMGQNSVVLQAMHKALDECGGGAGGTRNISGTNHYHIELEKLVATWYKRESALTFTSGYTANLAALSSFAKVFQDIVIISDEKNHNSMIEGIKAGRSEKTIFKHNNMEDLERVLKSYPLDKPKLIAFESVYSMDGDIAPIKEICDLADKYQAMTYIDEVHAVGMYGETGSGICERDNVRDRLTIIQGTFAKGVGLVGGFIAGDSEVVECVRSFGNAFIFSTSMPPIIASGCIASVTYLMDHKELRTAHQKQAQKLKDEFKKIGVELLPSVSHIVPVMIRDPFLARKLADELMARNGHYVQPINYPTVAKGEERLRFAPTPLHTDEMIEKLVHDYKLIWDDIC